MRFNKKNKEDPFNSLNEINNSRTTTFSSFLKKSDPILGEAEKTKSKQEQQDIKKKIKKIQKANKSAKGEINLENTVGKIIELKNVTKQYTNKVAIFDAIKNVNISVDKGDFVAIVGPSGSGKSTLLNLISGLDRPTAGEIIVNNINIAALKDSKLTKFRRDNIGFIFQSYNLLPTLNVKENAKIGQFLQSDKSKRLPIDQVLEDIDILDQANKRIDEISGGQQQRVSIARAISKNPLILFADEPTGALDEEASKKVLQKFIYLNEKYKTTVILVTHDNDVAKIADTIIRVKNSEVVKVEKNANRLTIDSLWKSKESQNGNT